MAKSADQFLDGVSAEGASANLGAANDVAQPAALGAFRDAPYTGVTPEVGMQDPSLAPLAQRNRDDDVLRGSPPLQKFAARSPAHVAATKDSWPLFSKLGQQAQDFDNLKNFGALGQIGSNFFAPMREAWQAREEAQRVLKTTPEGTPEHQQALGAYDAAASALTWSPLSGFANIFSRPVAEAAAPVLKRSGETTEQAAKSLNEGLNIFAQLVVPLPLALGKGRAPRDYGVEAAPTIDAEFSPLGPQPQLGGPQRLLEGPKAPGVRSEDTAAYGVQAEADAAHVAQMQESVAGLPTHSEVPSLTKEFLDDAGLQDKTVWVDPEVVQQIYFEGHAPFQAQAQAIGEALASGREVELPMSDWLTETAGTPYAETLLNATRFREDGVSVDQSRALAERDSAGAEAMQGVRGAEGEAGQGVVGGEEVPQVRATSGEVYAIEGQPLPDRGLAPANLLSNGIAYVGRPGGLHFEVMDDIPFPEGTDLVDTGFVTPDGQYLNRAEAAAWVKENEKADIKPSSNMNGTLDAIDYREQVPESVKKGKRVAPERVFPEDIEPTPQLRTLAASADRAVEEVFAELGLSELFDPKALKLSKARFANYDAMVSEAQAAASERIMQKVYDQIRKERAPEWKDNLARSLAALTQELPSSRTHVARMALQFNQGPLDEPLETPALKLSRASVAEEYGQTVVETLPRGMFGVGGVGADDAAGVLGYESGEELLSDLMDSENAVAESGLDGYRAFLKHTLNEAAADHARAELGFDISPEALSVAAREEAVLPAVEDLLNSELKAAAEELGLPFDKEAVKAVALAQFNAMPVKEALSPRRFERGMWQTGEKTQRALEKGDFPAAFIAKQQQLLNFYQLDAAHGLRKYATRSGKEIKALAKEPTVKRLSQPFLNQLHAYLPQWGVKVKREPQELEEALGGVSLAEFHSTILKTNADFPAIPEVEPTVLEDLSVGDYRTVTSFIHAMNRYGRELQTARTAEKREAKDEVIARAAASVPPRPPPRNSKVAADRTQNFIERFSGVVDTYDAMHRKVADWVEYFDRGDPNGVWAQNTWQPMYRATDEVGALTRETYLPVQKAWRAIPRSVKRTYNRKLAGNFVARNGQPVELYRRNIIPLALNAGTVESLGKTAEGLGLEPQGLMALINSHITPEEVSMVEAIWQGFEDLAPKVSETKRGLTGEGLRRVEASPVELGGKKTSGGYYPLRYSRDPKLNPQVAKWMEEREAQLAPDGVDQLFAQMMPDAQFLQERTGFVGVVNAEMQDISRVFDSHIKYAAYARAISDVRKFFYHPVISALVAQHFGPAYYKLIPEWLNSFVKPYQATEQAQKAIDTSVNVLVRNFTTATLTLSLSTGVAQAFGAANAIAVLSDGNWGAGVMRLAGGWGKFLGALSKTGVVDGKFTMLGLHEMFERSEFMRERFGSVEQNMTESLMELDNFLPGHLGLKEAHKWIERRGFHFIGWMEFITVSGPQWLAAEAKALGEGKSLEEAVLMADRSVVKGQGSGRKVDLASVQRTQGLIKAFYAFMSYFNQQYQLEVDIFRNVKLAGMEGGGEPPVPPDESDGLEAEQGPDGVWTVPMNRYNRSKAGLLAISILFVSGYLSQVSRGEEWEPEDILFDGLRPFFGVTTSLWGAQKVAKYLRGGKDAKVPQDFGFDGSLISRMFDIIEADTRLALVAGKRKKDGTPYARGQVAKTVANSLAPFGVVGAVPVGRAVEYIRQVNAGTQNPENWMDWYMGLTYGPKPQATKAKGSALR